MTLRALLAPFAAVAGLLAAACAPMVNLGGMAPPPALLATDIADGDDLGEPNGLEIPYGSGRVEIVGWVDNGEASGGLNGRLPLVGARDLLALRRSDYESTYRELIAEHDLDGLLNTMVSTERWTLNLVLLRVTSWRTEVGGIGYRFRDPADRALVNPGPPSS